MAIGALFGFNPRMRPFPHRKLPPFGALVLIILLSPLAAAQTPSPLANWQYSTGEILIPLGGPVPEWRVTLGGGVAAQPDYEGAKRYTIEPSGVIDIRYRDLAFISDGEGIGINVLHGPGYRAGVAVSYDLGRNQSDDPRLMHLGNIYPAPEAKLFGQYFLAPFVVTADLRQAVGGHAGLIGDLGAYIPLPVLPHTFLFIGPTVTLADDRYMQSYFGVGESQSAASGLPRFTADGGFKNAGIGATIVYLLGEHWLFISDMAFEQLLGSAAASPIPATRTQFTVDFNVAYRF